MAILPQPSIFSWREVEAASDLDRLRLVLLRELRRNGELRDLCGFDPCRGAAAVPSDDAFGRFLGLVIMERGRLRGIMDTLLAELAVVLPDLGRTLAADSKAIPSAGKPVTDGTKLAEADGRRDLDADWGTKTYKGTNSNGTAWEKVVRWFGYKLHLLVDSRYELPVAFEVTPASTGDPTKLLPLVDELAARHPEIYRSAKELSADKAYDSSDLKATLFDDHGIVPFIDHRALRLPERAARHG
jgi:hypothetical protein